MNENKTIRGLIEALHTLKSHQGSIDEVETILSQVTEVIDNFNEVNDVQGTAIRNWVSEEGAISERAKESMKLMGEDKNHFL